MSDSNNDVTADGKGWFFGKFLIYVILFIVLVVYVYGKNWDALPPTK
jgi:hypothetical protein